jgi:uncharacterized protein with PIN domain
VNEPVVFCGDWNSRPGGITHQYLARGCIDGRLAAPWRRPILAGEFSSDSGGSDKSASEDGTESCERMPGSDSDGDSSCTQLAEDETASPHQLSDPCLTKSLATLEIAAKQSSDADSDSDTRKKEGEFPRDGQSNTQTPRPVRYLLDNTLNKLCRWLRILGLDAALETDEEEKIRTSQAKMVLFERCSDETRTLVTTSTRLILRKDCPAGAYCIHPQHLNKLEVVIVHMLLTHGVVLEPSTFLGRCVVCNGRIVDVDDPSEKRRILLEYNAPTELSDMDVYECDGCRQGYWWCDRPTSSASRVKGQAIRLFSLCLRGGVPARRDLPDMFKMVDIDSERKQGWDFSIPGSELLKQKLDAVEWLGDENLQCAIRLQSAYAKLDEEGNDAGECIPFTNVTHDFVDVLDYIFFERSKLQVVGLLEVPPDFDRLNESDIHNGHLLPSSTWPSDHLAVGAKLTIHSRGTIHAREAGYVAPLSHSVVSTRNEATAISEPGLYSSGAPSREATLHPGGNSVVALSNHPPRCSCGCVPNIKSLFEMAEIRSKLKREREAAVAQAP